MRPLLHFPVRACPRCLVLLTCVFPQAAQLYERFSNDESLWWAVVGYEKDAKGGGMTAFIQATGDTPLDNMKALLKDTEVRRALPGVAARARTAPRLWSQQQ